MQNYVFQLDANKRPLDMLQPARARKLQKIGYEIREYLLEKWGRACVYCGTYDVPLQIEHIKAKAKGGTNRVGNLTLACSECNKAKGTQDVRNFLSGKPELLGRLLAQATLPLASATAVNATRFAIVKMV